MCTRVGNPEQFMSVYFFSSVSTFSFATKRTFVQGKFAFRKKGKSKGYGLGDTWGEGTYTFDVSYIYVVEDVNVANVNISYENLHTLEKI